MKLTATSILLLALALLSDLGLLAAAAGPALSLASNGHPLSLHVKRFAHRTLDRRGTLTEGTACADDAACQSGWCAFPSEVGRSTAFESRICRLMPATGPCTSNSQCETGTCTRGLCAVSTTTCRNNIDCKSGACSWGQCLSQAGAACVAGSVCSTGFSCPDSAVCPKDPVWATSTGTCRNGHLETAWEWGFSVQSDHSIARSQTRFRSTFCAPNSLGTKCTPSTICAGGAKCNSRGFCDFFPNGDACDSHNQCLSHMCSQDPLNLDAPDKICIPIPDGQPCSHAGGCASGVCSTSTSRCVPLTTTTSTRSRTTTTTSSSTPTRLPTGAVCATNTACSSGYCRAKLNADGTRAKQGTCDVKKAAGTACYQNGGCRSGVCTIARGAQSGTCK